MRSDRRSTSRRCLAWLVVVVAGCRGAPAASPAAAATALLPPAGEYTCHLEWPGGALGSCCVVRPEKDRLRLVEADGGDPLCYAGWEMGWRLVMVGDLFTVRETDPDKLPGLPEENRDLGPPTEVHATFHRKGAAYVATFDGGDHVTLTLEPKCEFAAE
jgi:hypothetical protein